MPTNKKQATTIAQNPATVLFSSYVIPMSHKARHTTTHISKVEFHQAPVTNE
jgi:hypothetical protein